jgi:hypothetical protein
VVSRANHRTQRWRSIFDPLKPGGLFHLRAHHLDELLSRQNPWDFSCAQRTRKTIVTLWETHKKRWKTTIFDREIHYKWPFSIAIIYNNGTSPLIIYEWRTKLLTTLLAMDMAKVGGPLSVVKVFTQL